jgi:hypothetical protein
MSSVLSRPRVIGLVCGAGAVGLGIAYMLAAGAPRSYVFVNLASLVLGGTAWIALRPAESSRLAGAGIVTLALAMLLVLTTLFSVPVEGASRWVSVGPLTLQLSLIVLPLMIVMYARQPDAIGTGGIIAAALALALQPDRAMAGVLLAGLLPLAIITARPLQIAAAAASALAFAWTLLKPDLLPAVPYVDQILYSAFNIHLLAGLAVVAGAAVLLLPAILGLLSKVGDRGILLAFGGSWAGVVAAAALGNYPTPLVGYGGSAVLGYLLSVSLLPQAAREAGVGGAPTSLPNERSSQEPRAELRAAQLA